jgi:hypothetical protein
MKTRLFKISMAAVFFMMSTVAVLAEGNNTLPGSINAFEKHYGQILELGRGATDALLYIDYENQDGKIPEALLNLGYTVTVATDWYDFTNKLNLGDYGLAVGFNQNFGWGAWKPGLIAALTNYIAGGGAVVFNDWTRDNDFAVLFETSFTGNFNQTIMNLDPSIEYNVSNPIILSNAGWSVFSTGLVPIGAGMPLATFGNGEIAIVRGNGGKTIVLGYLTDAPAAEYRQQLFENLFEAVAPPPPPVPVSNWALYLGILLMLTFVVIRFRRMM